jgi:hypothetical protein
MITNTEGHALITEAFRRSHCYRKFEGDHQCHGKITIAPGLCKLDCPLCGGLVMDTRQAMRDLDDSQAKFMFMVEEPGE